MDTIVAAYAAALKGGMTVRLPFYGWLDRRLMGDASVAEPVAGQPQAGASSPVEVSSQKPVKKAAAEPRKRSVDRMHAKDDAVLKALMAAT